MTGSYEGTYTTCGLACSTMITVLLSMILGFHLLLLAGFQIAFVLGLFAHALHGIHHIALLGQERVAEVSGPLNVVRPGD